MSEEPRAVRIPILPEGLDPDHPGLMEMMIGGLHRADSLRLEAGAAQALGLERPYACRLTERGVRRVTSLLQPGDLAVVTRGREPISPHEVYAVRLGGHVEFSFVMWNGHQLLLLPDEGQTDFVVLDTRKPPELERLVVGRLATVVRGAPESER